MKLPIKSHAEMNFLRFSEEKIIIFLLLLQIFCIQWLNLTKYYSILMDVILFLYLLRRKMKAGVCFSIIILIQYIAVDSLVSYFRLRIFFYNLRFILYFVLIILFFGAVASKKKSRQKIMSDLFFVINGYMILNIPVLLLELHDHLYLAGRYPADLTNPFKPDLISGLFGYNGTPMLGLFSCFFFIYDLWYFRTKLFKKHKFFFLVYYFLMLAFYLYISILNDNKSFYIFLLFSYGIYFLSIQGNIQKLKEKIRWAGKGIIIALSGSLLVFIVYRFYDPFRSKMDYAVRIITDALEGNFSAGSSDRFAMIHYFFTENINILFGTGFSSMGWKEKMGFGFEHFGQNDLGAFLLIGGVGIVFSLLLILFNVLKEINRSGFLSFLELAFMIFAMLMTQPITGPSITISTMLLFLVCSFGSNNDVSLVFF